MPRAAKSLGPLTDSDPQLKDLNKVPARELNNTRLTKALTSSVPKPAFTHKSEHADHSLSPPKMCIGTGSDANTGRWFQVCLTAERKYCRTVFITNPIIDTDIYFAGTDIPRLLAIQKELQPVCKKTRVSPYPSPSTSSQSISSSPAHRTHSATRSNSGPSPSLTPSSPTAGPLPALRVGERSMLPNTPATLIGWTKDGEAQVDLVVISGADGRVRLKDYKVELGQYGFEQMNALQLYDADTYEWVDIRWNFPLPVYVVGQLVAVKYKAVTQVMGLNDLVTACRVLN